MNVPTMQMDKHDASAHVQEYADVINRGRALPGDAELLDGYRAMERGKVVIDLIECFTATGVGSDHLPRLAVCRADAKVCYLRVSSRVAKFGADVPHPASHHKHRYVDIPRETFRPTLSAPPDHTGSAMVKDGEALVPSIPPRCRPRGSLGRYLILWEAVWRKMPPKDPFLLLPLRWPLFWVVAQWDLTPLEMSILRTMRVNT